ncbi:EF-hand domain-containing protein [Nocardia huaxiensis]|uniref:EF-hand domain-containing protein n=1 Tax=Nocardia huaxiensis TaxID=2755382 RepID=A0A7D6Z3K4_9NOCA|nr:EF-hand domain-containing protein [Nocardia huaxiensis]QLY30184.1 EF-hand domain-containing protein [Nocardia huaxiensis]UFS96201.1 EF-hand domain-containing protein [Nocardia huaxiensis]
MDISDFLARKLARRFQTFDFDGDGRIERSDFESSAAALAAEFGHGPDSPARKHLLDLSLALWDHLVTVADANADGVITLPEYQRAFADGLLVTEATFERGYRPFLEAITAIADTDADGNLTVTDHIRWTGALMHLPESDARAIHHRLDTDHDGYITADDLLQAIHDYYFDETPTGPGAWLLGPLPD